MFGSKIPFFDFFRSSSGWSVIGGNTQFSSSFFNDFFWQRITKQEARETYSSALMEQFGLFAFLQLLCLFFDCLWDTEPGYPGILGGTNVFHRPSGNSELKRKATQSSKCNSELKKQHRAQDIWIRRLELSSSAGNGQGNTELVLHSRTPEPGGVTST